MPDATSTMDSTAKNVRPLPAPGAPNAATGAAPKRGRLPFLILGGIALVAAVGGGIYLLATSGQESTDDAQIEANVVPIGARVGGQVAHVVVKENQAVKKGAVLVELDDADLRARAKQAEAELETARAQAAAAEAQMRVVEASAKGGFNSARAQVSGSSVAVSSADAQIAAARAGLERAKAEAHKAELDLARAQQLKAANAVPQQMLDNAQAARDASHAAVAQAQAQLSAAEEAKRAAQSRVAEAQGRLDQSAPIDAQIASAHAASDLANARVKAAEAALELARNQLSYARVVAPDDGVVSRLSVQEGQLLQPGQPIAELVPEETYVVANFKETQVGRMRPGQKAEIRVDAFGGRELEGTVESLSGGTGARFSLLPPDNASGNFVKVVQRVPVRIAWRKPPELPLRAGLSAEVTVHVGKE